MVVEGRGCVEEGVYSRKGGGDHRRSREGSDGAGKGICDDCGEPWKGLRASLEFLFQVLRWHS